MDLAGLTVEVAKTLVGTTFEVTLEDGRTTTLRLDDAVPFDVRQPRRARVTPKRTPFSLYFVGDPAIVMPQGMYEFRSENANFDNLFIVPVGHDDQGTEYEAVFT